MLTGYKGKNIFLTGHSGFKGSWMAEMLTVLEANVTGYSLEPNTQPAHLALLQPKYNSILGDILNYEKLIASLTASSAEIVFHLAAQPLVRESYADPFTTYNTNVMGTLNVLRAAQACASVKAVVIITTDKVYENKEWDYPYRENDQLGGYDMYSSSKACSEILVSSFRNSFLNIDDYGKNHNILVATARAGNVIGGGDWSKDRLIPDLVRAASRHEKVNIRSPHAIRPWQHVMDCLYGYLLLGEKLLAGKKDFAEAWNFAPHIHEAKTVEDVIAVAKQRWHDIEPEYERNGDHVHEASLLKLDNSKSIKKLKWTPAYNTNAAIEKTIDWYKEFYLNDRISTAENISGFLSLINSPEAVAETAY